MKKSQLSNDTYMLQKLKMQNNIIHWFCLWSHKYKNMSVNDEQQIQDWFSPKEMNQAGEGIQGYLFPPPRM